MRIRMILVGGLLAVGALSIGPLLVSSADSKGTTSKLVVAMQSPHGETRLQACRELSMHRGETIRSLIQLLENHDGKHDTLEPSDPVVLAIRMLGELRSVEAVNVLIQNLHITRRTVFRSSDEVPGPQNMHPAIKALIEIGKPSSRAAISRLGMDIPPVDRERLCWVLAMTEGSGVGQMLLEREVQREQNRLRRGNLGVALRIYMSIEFPN